MAFTKYGLKWADDQDPLLLEFHMIRQTDAFLACKGTTRLQHYLAAHELLWPEDDQHRWFMAGMQSIVQNQITVLMGCASSGKTYLMVAHALIDFFCFPHTSLALISSTDSRSLEIRIWGRMKELFNRAKLRHDWLPGYVLESKMAIVPDEVDENNVLGRAMTMGIICVPCVSGGRFVGMGKFQGVKAPNSPGKQDGLLKHYGDEAAAMQSSFLDAYSNWTVNDRFKGVMGGNPLDISDPLCTAGEPVGGWDAFVDDGKTQEWNSKWFNAHVIAYDGRDTPNNDFPGVRYPFLVTSKWVDSLATTHGEDSWQWYSQGVGKPSKSMVSDRVITMGFCEKHHAFEDVVWRSTPLLRIYAIDPAYGGGDRCVAGMCQIGFDMNGRQILAVSQPQIVPIRVNFHSEPEEQIATFVKDRADKLGIAPENIFYDSFGRGTLGFAFAKVFGANCPVPVDAGAKPTARPVRFDLYVTEHGQRRLKRCDEEYSKFITEMWFSTREAVHSEQVRTLPREVAQEGQLRMYSVVAGNRVEVESKEDMKERVKKSPDLYDWFAVLVEGARQRGFKIGRIGAQVESKTPDAFSWFRDLQTKSAKVRRQSALSFGE